MLGHSGAELGRGELKLIMRQTTDCHCANGPSQALDAGSEQSLIAPAQAQGESLAVSSLFF